MHQVRTEDGRMIMVPDSMPPSPLDPLHTRLDRVEFYKSILGRAASRGPADTKTVKRFLCRHDLFFLLVYMLHRKDVNRDWLYDRCQEVQHAPDGYLDLWAREHYKSTIITLGKTLQDVLINPEKTTCIFSMSRPAAKKPLRQIKTECENNVELRETFDDVLWADPKKQAPKWSEDDGLIFKRKGNPKESSLEAWGMIDGIPTGAHFDVRVYDDVIERRAVTNPDMIRKVTESWELSLALGKEGGTERYVGTRYHTNDPYTTIIDRQAATPRIYAATIDGKEEGEPVLMSRAELKKRRRNWGAFTFGAQMLQNPTADRKQGFRQEWIQFYEGENEGSNCNKYILIDPSSAKKKESDYTAMVVIGLGPDHNYYLLDMIRDRLNLAERTKALFSLHKRWRPKGVGYEKYGMQCDIEHIREKMEEENYRFHITPLGGNMSKPDRIRRMIPIFEQERFFMPRDMIKEDYEGRQINLVHTFIKEEYNSFPVGAHEDVFDAIARTQDLDMVWPAADKQEDRYARRKKRRAHLRVVSPWAA